MVSPPSPIAIGGRSARVRCTADASSSQESQSAEIPCSAPATEVRRNATATSGRRASESPNARRSRGVARLAAALPANRSTSRTPSIASRNAARAIASSTNAVTASRRCVIASTSVSGERIHCRNRRAPIGVCVRSSTLSNVPVVSPPRSDSVSSRLRRVISSNGMTPPGRSITGRARCGTPEGWSSRKYRSNAPAAPTAASSAAPNPKPSSDCTP